MLTEPTGHYDDRKVEIPLEDTDNSLIFERSGPYGFWTIRFRSGPVPAQLQGQYTKYEVAYRAANAYLTQKDRKLDPQGESLDKIKTDVTKPKGK